MMNVLFCWILLRARAMLFRMLCKGFTGTIHRQHYIYFVAYYKEQNHLSSIRYCVLSDYLHHNANVVHFFVYHMLQNLKILLPRVSHVHYFSDGAPSQYKNFQNLTNLIHHQEDHQLSAEQHFFATGHGESSCDGVGGTVKCLVTHSSFQNNLILNVDLMYNWCVDNIPGIIFIKINTDDVQNHITKFSLEERYSSADCFQGSRIHHCFIPTANGFEMKIISADKGASIVSISKIQAPSLT